MDGFTFNGVEYSKDNGILLMKLPGFFNMSPNKFSVQDNASKGGSLYSFQGNRGKQIAINFAVVADSLQELYNRVDELKLELDSSLGEKVLSLWFEDDLEIPRQYRAFVQDELLVDFISNYSATCSVTFFVTTGFAETQSEYEESYTITTNPETVSVPETSGEVVPGTVEALPVIVIKNTGTLTSQIIISNATSGKSCTWNGTLENGQWLRMDAQRIHVEKSVDSGSNWVSVVSGLSETDRPIKLSPNVVNEITLEGISGGTMEVTYRGRYK